MGRYARPPQWGTPLYSTEEVSVMPGTRGTAPGPAVQDAGSVDAVLRELDKARAEVQRLEAENQELRAQVGRPARQAPKRPRFGMSEGERQDLVDRGVTTDPFDGTARNAIDEGIRPGNPTAKKVAEKAHKAARPAAGDTEPSDPK